MFFLTDQPIDAAALRARLQCPENGALVVFEGWVRNHHQGRPVTRLEYEAFADMAMLEGEALVDSVKASFPGISIICVHRHGDLEPGDIAVWVGAASAHRDDAFRSCRQVIEELKRRLPIWKKEYHPGMDPVWVNCTEDAVAKNNEAAYHARQSSLPEVGADGQQRLTKARVLIVGVGGLGCPAALYLAGAGVGHITLMDGGRVEYSNLHRQVLFESADVGAAKASRAAWALRARNPHIKIDGIDADFTAADIPARLRGQSVVLDCTDNFTTRLLLHDACLQAGVPLVQAAIYRWEGLLNVYQRGTGGCAYCSGLPQQSAELDTVGTCDGAPVFGPAVGMLGLMQATETVKWLLGRPPGERACAHTLLVDLLSNEISRIARPARKDCPHCRDTADGSAGPTPAAGNDASLWIEWGGLNALQNPLLVALATAEECARDPQLAAMDRIDPSDTARIHHLAATGNRPLVLACPHGLRSAAVGRMLRARGTAQVYTLIRHNPEP